MEENNDETTNLEKELDKIIVKILIPITDELKSKTREIKQKRLELKNKIYNIKQLKQSLINKRNKLNKQKVIYENNMNGDFSNVKTCRECLINYINIIDKKQNDFLKEKDDYYELKLRKKQLEFNNLLIDLVKEKYTIEQKKRIKRKMSFEAPKKLNQSTHSIPKNLNKSFKSDTREETKNKTINKSITSKKVLKSKNNSIDSNNKNKNYNKKNNKYLNRKNSNESNGNNNMPDISGEIEKLINNYSTKKNGLKSINTINSDNYNDGLTQLKEINKDTKSIENDLKELMNSYINQDKES